MSVTISERFVRPSWFGIRGERMSVPYHIAAASFYDRMKNPHALKKYLQAKKNFRRFAFRRGPDARKAMKWARIMDKWAWRVRR